MLYGKYLHKKLTLLIQKDFISVVLLTMILVYILPLDSRLLKPLQNLKLIFLSSPLSNPSPFHHNCQQPRYCEAFFYWFTRYFHFSCFRYCLSYAGDCILWLYGDPYTSNALYERVYWQSEFFCDFHMRVFPGRLYRFHSMTFFRVHLA